MEIKKGTPSRTSLYDEHLKLNAKMIDFHGWNMPLEYTKIVDEHLSVRNNVGIFDISHMGDIVISGKNSNEFVDYLFPTKISDLKVNECIYTSFLDDNGKMIDDTIIERVDENKFFLIPNAANIYKIFKWIDGNKKNYDVEIIDYSDKISHIAVQGPKTEDILKELNIKMPMQFRFLLERIDYDNLLIDDKKMIVSGTGYTGERGVELIIPNVYAAELWEKIIRILPKYGGLPCGLGSRDTLRMEKGMLLSGQDFNDDRTPYEASISFIINYEHDFIGKTKLMESKNKYSIIFRGFKLNGKNIPRNGFKIYHDNEVIGNITSGSLSPILNCGIGLGYIDRRFVKTKEPVFIDIRGKQIEANISKPKLL